MLNQIVESESALRADIIDALALRGEVKCALYGNLGGDTGDHFDIGSYLLN